MSAYELRKRPLLGTRAFLHAILVDGVTIYEQVGPFSEDEIESRVNSHLNPARSEFIYSPSFVPGARGTSKSYGAKGGRAGRKTKAERDMPWLPPETDE